ncbi:YegP family protein [Arthrobacter sp. UC242_113]|uniref:YegP family protein n=1 Tax=Arthrobacter sp. UC242_113 TaxID=3374550 RepID=UPI00375843FF
MAGVFEVFVDAESQFRFRLKAPDGSVLAVSAPFADKRSAAAGIADVRECAGTGLITDLSPAAAPVRESAQATESAQVQPAVPAVSAPAPAPAKVLPARPDHRRQGFRKKRTPSEAPGSPLCRPAPSAEPARWTGAAQPPSQAGPQQLTDVMKSQRDSSR